MLHHQVTLLAVLVFLAAALATTHGSPIEPPPPAGPDFLGDIVDLQYRLAAITDTTNAWLRRQRDRADSLVTIINRSVLAAIANSVQLIGRQRRQTDLTLRNDCFAVDNAERVRRHGWLAGNSTAMGDQIAGCAQMMHGDIDRLVKQKFYQHYRYVQAEMLDKNRRILVAFELYNPVKHQAPIITLLTEIVETTEDSFRDYLKPEVEANLALVAQNGQLISAMATTCAYDVATYFSELAHGLLAVC